jgi:hypothetical protein
MPTLMGYDSDHPKAHGEVGKCGVAIDSLRDMEILLDGIDPAAISTSMTINGPAAIMFAFYVANAEKRGVPFAKLRGTLQNDILKEYIAQKCVVLPAVAEPAHHRRPNRVRDPERAAAGTRSASRAITSARPAAPPRRSWRSRSPTGSRTSRSA